MTCPTRRRASSAAGAASSSAPWTLSPDISSTTAPAQGRAVSTVGTALLGRCTKSKPPREPSGGTSIRRPTQPACRACCSPRGAQQRNVVCSYKQALSAAASLRPGRQCRASDGVKPRGWEGQGKMQQHTPRPTARRRGTSTQSATARGAHLVAGAPARRVPRPPLAGLILGRSRRTYKR